MTMAIKIPCWTLDTTPSRRSLHAWINGVVFLGTLLALRTSNALGQVPAACSADQRSPLVITTHEVGGLPFDAKAAVLRRLCPEARDTMISVGSDRTYPGLAFREDRTLVVMQYSNATEKIVGDRPGDGWLIRGSAMLFEGISLSADWSTLSQSLGSHQTSLGEVLVVRFCNLPRFLFTLDVDASNVRKLPDGRVDESTIPDSAMLHHVTVLSGSLANSLTPC